MLTDRKKLADHLQRYALKSAELAAAFTGAEKLATKLRSAPIADQREAVIDLVERVDVSATEMTLAVRTAKLKQQLGLTEATDEDDGVSVHLTIALKMANKADSSKLIINGTIECKPNRAEITAIARGFCWFEELTSGKAKSFRHIAKREGVTATYISRLIEQALISPAASQKARVIPTL